MAVSLPCKREIIIIDDCSNDSTRDYLNILDNPTDIKVIFHEYNRGKGAALRTGFQKATGDVIIIYFTSYPVGHFPAYDKRDFITS